MSIPEHIIEQLKDSADIVSIIGKHVDLKRNGNNFKGCCPFHNEKTPSFHIKTDEGFYKCFGCGVSGNAISFLMDFEGQSFIEALETLSEQTGISIPKNAPNPALNYKKTPKPAYQSSKPQTQAFNNAKAAQTTVSAKGDVAQSVQAPTAQPSNAHNQPHGSYNNGITDASTTNTQNLVRHQQQGMQQQNTEQQAQHMSHAAMHSYDDINAQLNAAADDINGGYDDGYTTQVSDNSPFSPESAAFDTTPSFMDIPFDGDVSQTSTNPDGNLYDLLTRICDYYIKQRKKSPKALMYFNKRGLTEKTMDTFCLGYAPASWEHLCEYFAEDIEGLKVLGLIRQRKTGNGNYCLLRDRVIFPIKDHKGRIVGFGGRTLNAEEQPKYINSPDSVVFKKQTILYGLYESRQVRAKNWLVVEGYMDVIALHQAGIYGAVASMGTATNAEQMKKLFKLNPVLTLAFDGDKAGQTAAWRAMESVLPILADEYELRFLPLPENDDPDTLIKKEGAQAMQERIDTAPPLSEFLFQQLIQKYNVNSPEGKGQLLSSLRKMLSNMPEYSSYKGLLTKEIKNKLGMGYVSFEERKKQQESLKKYRDQLLNFDNKHDTQTSVTYLLLLAPQLVNQCTHILDLLPQPSLVATTIKSIVQTQSICVDYTNEQRMSFILSYLLTVLSDTKQKQLLESFNQFLAMIELAHSSQQTDTKSDDAANYAQASVFNATDEWIEPIFNETLLSYEEKLLRQALKTTATTADVKQINDRLTEVRKKLQYRMTEA